MLNVYVIGCGGIGRVVINALPEVIASLSLDLLESYGSRIQTYLENAGNVAIPVCVDRITLIDGDVFNPRNALRQGAGAGSKLVTGLRKLKEGVQTEQDKLVLRLVEEVASRNQEDVPALLKALQNTVLRQTFLQRMQLRGYNNYLNPDNIEEIIPLEPEPNPRTEATPFDHPIDRNVIFLCVDNMKTRYEVSKYAERFDNIVVINGGNEKTIGHVTMYERANGEAKDPNLYELFPNVRPDADLRPDEEHCTNVAPKHDQIALTNGMVAMAMLAVFNKWLRNGMRVEGRNGEAKRKNEVLMDLESLSMVTVNHPLNK